MPLAGLPGLLLNDTFVVFGSDGITNHFIAAPSKDLTQLPTQELLRVVHSLLFSRLLVHTQFMMARTGRTWQQASKQWDTLPSRAAGLRFEAAVGFASSLIDRWDPEFSIVW